MNLMANYINKIKKFFDLNYYFKMEENHFEYMIRQDALIKEALSSTKLGISEDPYCDHEIVVSMTTYGNRLYSAAPVIESIMQGSMRPNHFVLNLGEDLNGKKLPVALQNQQKRGLEINYGKDIRSYKKLIPTLKKYPEAAIITIDDDLIYYYDLVEKLVHTYIESPQFIIANRIHRIKLRNDMHPVEYMSWDQEANPEDVSFLNFSTGGGGTLYPPHSLSEEVLNEDVFMDVCPYADDVWFYSMALLKGTMTKKCYTHDHQGRDFVYNDKIQDSGLYNVNTSNKNKRCRNDDQLEAVFDKYDLWSKLKEHG